MQSEVAAVADTRHHGVGNRADANLDGRAIIDIAADVTRNGLFGFTDRPGIETDRRTRYLYFVMNLARLQTGVTMRPRGLIVDLGDDEPRPGDSGLLIVVGERKAVLAVLV